MPPRVSFSKTDELPDELQAWVSCVRQQAIANHQRRVVVLCGDSAWQKCWVDKATQALAITAMLCLSDRIPGALPPRKARTQLGHEYDAILFDAYDQLDVDALGAISGTLRGGGLLILLIPAPERWSIVQRSRFHQRAWRLLQDHAGVYFVTPSAPLPICLNTVSDKPCSNMVPAPFATAEQQQVVTVIEETALSQHPRPLVLVSDRGRGKSSALGLAAGRLLQQGIRRIIVTAPRLITSDPIFEHAQRTCVNAYSERGLLTTKQGQLKFMAPDALLLEKPPADLLLVDEAAAIPLSLLQALLENYPCIVFATTVHGYEGTGRGFTLKFNKVLDVVTPGWQRLLMQQPVRWAEHDPVELWIDRLLCLDAELSAVSTAVVSEQCTMKLLDRDALIRDERLLSALFALLVHAHYRTQPSDLIHLMDDENVRIYTLNDGDNIVAAALINQEGGYDMELSSQIYRGLRRPAGNLLAQTLTFHAGCEHAATLTYARIMRIAVHPLLQGRGLGSKLLKYVMKTETQYVDAIGSSFGGTNELLRFWEAAGFAPVRIGFTRDHASGVHSVIVLHALNESGQVVFNEVRQRFRHYLGTWLSEPLSDLDEELKICIAGDVADDEKNLNEADRKEIVSFTDNHRGYEAVMWPVKKLVTYHSRELALLSDADRLVIEARVLRKLSWKQTVKMINAAGVAEAVQRLKRAIGHLMHSVYDH